MRDFESRRRRSPDRAGAVFVRPNLLADTFASVAALPELVPAGRDLSPADARTSKIFPSTQCAGGPIRQYSSAIRSLRAQGVFAYANLFVRRRWNFGNGP